MRVLMIHHALVTLSNHRLPELLAARPGVQLTVLTPHWWDEESRRVAQEKTYDPHYKIRQAPAATFGKARPNLFAFRQGLGATLRRVRPEIVDCYEEPFSLVMGQVLSRLRLHAVGAKLMFYSAQNIRKQYPLPFRLIEQWAFRRAAYANVCCTEAGEVLRGKGYQHTLKRIPLAADHNVFKPMPAARAEVRAKLGLQERRVVGFLGRLDRDKGVQDVIAALQQLPADTVALLVGGGAQAEFAAQAQAAGLGERVRFTGAVARTEAASYLNAMDVLAVPSRTTPHWKEQFGRIIVEAFMCGVPVVGSDSGAIPEVVSDSGLIFPEGDVAALAAACTRLLDDAAATAKLTELARYRALAEFTWERVAEQRYRVYEEMMAVDEGPR